jgi:hypothetical protein
MEKMTMKMHKRAILIGAGVAFMAFGANAQAQVDLTCDDIDFTGELLAEYPYASEGCLDVIERNGERFAKMQVELVSTGNNRATFRFKHRDGSYGPTHSIQLDPGFRAEIDGRNYRIRELGPGQELTVYLPPDRWEAHVAQVSDVDDSVVITPVEIEDADDSGSMMAALPSTASPMPLFGLLGGLALLGAAGLRRLRSAD